MDEFYQQHEDNKDVYDAICEAEQNLKDAYGLEVVAGRGFSEEYGDDVNKLVINETAARMLGYVV